MTQKNSLSKKSNSFSTFMAMPAVRQKINDVVMGERGSQFIASIVTAVGATPALAKCEHGSILSAALLGEALKLSPSPQLGHFYMVPFNDNKRGITVAQFQLGYKGYVQLAIRSGQYRKINVVAIKEGELIKYDPLNEDIIVTFIGDEEEREAAETIGYYAMFELISGFRKAIYWSKSKMQAHARKYSQGYASDLRNGKSYTFWSKDFDGMAYKTMLRQMISKWGIMSVDLQKAFSSDMGVIKEDGTADYVDGFESDDAFKPAEVTADIPTNQDVNEPIDDTELPFDLDSGEDLPDDIEAQFFGR